MGSAGAARGDRGWRDDQVAAAQLPGGRERRQRPTARRCGIEGARLMSDAVHHLWVFS